MVIIYAISKYDYYSGTLPLVPAENKRIDGSRCGFKHKTGSSGEDDVGDEFNAGVAKRQQ